MNRHITIFFSVVITITIAILLQPLQPLIAQDGRNQLPSSFKLDITHLRHEYQGWNNCGPTTMTMGLSYFGYEADQYPAAQFMKPHREDKNVHPWEMVAYVNEVVAVTNNVRALYRPAGDFQLLKELLSSDFPVIIEKGYEPEGYDWMGHYVLLIGYDDTEEIFYTYDSFSGHGNFQGLREPYQKVENYWWHFNNMFIVLYPPEREEELMGILGERADLEAAYTLAGQIAQQRAQSNPNDAWAWFNLGDALTMLGQYQTATAMFRQAFNLGLPWRTLWYRHTPFEAFYQSGDFATVLRLVDANLANTTYVEEWHYYRGLVAASRGDVEAARRYFNTAIGYNSNYQEAIDALNALNNGTFVSITEVTS